MSKRLLGVFLGALLVLLSFWIHWALGYLAVILVAAWLVFAIVPSRYRPYAVAIYILFVIVLIGTTFLHDYWVRGLIIRGNEEPSAISGNPARSLQLIGLRAFLIALVIGTAVILALRWGLLYVSAEYVLQLPTSLQITRKAAMDYLWDLFLQRARALVVVDKGQVASESPSPLRSQVGGKGIIAVKPMNAVILRTDKGERILGPDSASLQHFDRIDHVIDLRRQSAEQTFREIMTQDRIPLSFRVNVSYQVSSTSDAGAQYVKTYSTISGSYPVYEDTIRQVANKTPSEGYPKAVLAVTEVALRDVVGTLGLASFMGASDPLNLGDLGRRIAGALEPLVREWGLAVRRVDVIDVRPPREVRRAALDLWRKRQESKIAVEGVKGESEALFEWTGGVRSSLVTETDARRTLFEGILDTLRSYEIDVSEAVAQQLLEFVTREASVFSSPGMRPSVKQPQQDREQDQGGFDQADPSLGRQAP